MRKKLNKICFVILIIDVIFLCGCGNKNSMSNNYFIGVIETTGLKEESALVFYDNEYNKVGGIYLELASLGSVSSYAKCSDNYVYLLPLGVTGEYKNTEIIRINKDTGEYQYLDFQKNMITEFVVNNNCVYIAKTDINDEACAYVNMINENTEETKELIVKGELADNLFMVNNKLILSTLYYDNDIIKSKVYFINSLTLEIEDEKELSEYGISVSDILFSNGRYYFAFRTKASDSNESEVSSDYAVAFEENPINSNEILGEQVEIINIGMPSSQILEYNNELIFVNYDEVLDIGCQIAKYSIGKKTISNYALSDKIRQAAIYEDSLITMSENKIIEYNIEDNFKESRICNLKQQLKNSSESYFSTFYLYGRDT